MERFLPPSNAAALDLALTYPYDRPDHSYGLAGSSMTVVPPDFCLLNRVPVIACGSNAAPNQLIRKYSTLETDPIYVTKAILEDFLCCYSAHITAYGSIPATLAHIKGSATDCHITWLTQQQLEHMHKTEAVGSNYKFSKLENIKLFCDEKGHLTEAYSYISLLGNLQVKGSPIAVAGIKATPSPSLQLDQFSIQKKLLTEISPDLTVEEFVFGNISKMQLRRARVGLLKQYAEPFYYPHETVILT